MEENTTVTFKWENTTLSGRIEKEYENSFLVEIDNPTKEIADSYNGRMVVSKKDCKVEEKN
ncbi:DUF2187 domain-containing protein [Tetragenococcus koreensis]|uniref:DUF2187 domain-containing protein n=1 Tax=Tetragenococcus koreensis TaxID=290335 RepID=A0AAN4UAJ2_9ENTE|nr:DUF2187 domain-containing protein [Tetragenococcus koreensis]AYW45171.1 DUF2187 domain-containing protein [Tetragenococcus koreensis]MCF1584509.1 DUF2187 domain-containing protein [Tetragenococcus koreensis]MCF1614058.1 DUF2187 domain-containing protein [Tetragenococcus koreensis]MCF1616568.1 DUF2187 domain-containing protein [Tetragenococcus koreensis]MCF1620515.1 DUF2187 domain-containing protein [Tetragenococcus koreensis]